MPVTRPQKLLYVINHMDWFWSHRLPLAAGAQEAGWDVTVAASGASSDKKLASRGFHAADLPNPEGKFIGFAVLETVFEIFRVLSREKPDLMHAITLKYAFIAGLCARLYPKMRVVYTIAGLGYLFSGEGVKPRLLRAVIGPALKFALKHPQASLIFQNPDDMDLMIKHGFCRAEAAHLIRGSGVDTDAFKPSDVRPETPPIVLMPTRLVHDKGVAVFVAAARLLKKRGSEARFQIAGGLSASNPLAISEAEMKDMVSDGTVEWLGKVDDMPGLLARATLVAYPSYYREGVPKVLLEAAAAGKAIVTTDHPGCREAVADGVNGLLVPIKDAGSLADAIADLLSHPDKRAAMESSGRARALGEFDVHLIVSQTLALYA
ncbi:MAG: glycosyltransferase family 4 protein [Alphaproteobacteria bacterium]|nr:glycosyltransferase family 4 protein [Alphaproteobacteria bacterium]